MLVLRPTSLWCVGKDRIETCLIQTTVPRTNTKLSNIAAKSAQRDQRVLQTHETRFRKVPGDAEVAEEIASHLPQIKPPEVRSAGSGSGSLHRGQRAVMTLGMWWHGSRTLPCSPVYESLLGQQSPDWMSGRRSSLPPQALQFGPT